jgi:capsular exopolysaccharide synthesis family protein
MRDDMDDSRDGARDEGGLDPRLVLQFLRRRKLAISLVTVPLLVVAVLLPLLIPKTYDATAKIAVQNRPEVLEFGADFMPNAGPQLPGRTQIDQLTALALSDTVLGSVVDRLPPPSGDSKSLKTRAKEALGMELPPMGPEQLRAQRIEMLRRSLRVEPGGGGAMLLILATATDPQSAAGIANAVSEAFIRYQIEQRDEASRRTLAWLAEQIYELREQVARREETLAKLVVDSDLSVGGQGNERQEETLAAVETEINQVEVELSSTKQRLDVLAPRVRSSRRVGANDPEFNRIRDQYMQARSDLDRARLAFTPTHPEVVRLEGVVSALAAQIGMGVDDAVPAIPTAEELAEYAQLSSQRAALEGRVRALREKQQEMLEQRGPRTQARSRYERLKGELEIDRQMLEVLMRRRNETLLTAGTKYQAAQILDMAIPPLYASNSARKKALVLGVAFAFAAGFGFAVLREFMDPRVRDTDEVARVLHLPVLGLIPDVVSNEAPPEQQAGLSAGSQAAEGYRKLRTALLFSMGAAKSSSLVVSSAIAGEGKSTVSSNLAASFAGMGRKVLLVDADLRRGRLDRVFGVHGKAGLAELLANDERFEDLVLRPVGADFDLLTAGAHPTNPSELLGGAAFTTLLRRLESEYDLVILDSPVLLAVPDALLLAAVADGTLLVHRPGSVEKRALHRMRKELAQAGARVLGIAFNHVETGDPYLYPAYMSSPYIQGSSSAKSSRRSVPREGSTRRAES